MERIEAILRDTPMPITRDIPSLMYGWAYYIYMLVSTAYENNEKARITHW